VRAILSSPVLETFNLLQMSREVVNEIIPHLRIMLVQFLALHGVVSDCEWSAGLEHESDGTFRDTHWLQLSGGSGLEFGVGDTVRNTTAFVWKTTRLELVGTTTVATVDETHEFGGDIAVIVRGSVSVACDVPSRREDEDISKRGSGIARLGGQDGEDGGVDVVDGDGTNVDEFGQIILVWSVISGPSDNIEGAVLLKRVEQFAAESVDDLVLVLGIERVWCRRVEEVARVGETIGTERTKFRKFKMRAPDLTDVTTRRSVDESDRESETSRDNDDLTRFDPEFAEFGGDIENTLLGHNEVVSVAVDVGGMIHALVAHVCVCGNSFTKGWVARSCNSLDTGNKVDIVSLRDIEWEPSELSWADVNFGVEGKEARFGIRIVWEGVVSLMGDCWSNSI
jgi:hypothetical protein